MAFEGVEQGNALNLETQFAVITAFIAAGHGYGSAGLAEVGEVDVFLSEQADFTRAGVVLECHDAEVAAAACRARFEFGDHAAETYLASLLRLHLVECLYSAQAVMEFHVIVVERMGREIHANQFALLFKQHGRRHGRRRLDERAAGSVELAHIAEQRCRLLQGRALVLLSVAQELLVEGLVA